MSYKRVDWKDYPNTDTPITADLLNVMDKGISDNDGAIENIVSGVTEVGSAGKLGSETKGSEKLPIYIENGIAKECIPASEVKNEDGIVSNKAVYTALRNGSVTKVGTETVGGNYTYVYMKSGKPTASTGSLGSATVPVYLKDGRFYECNLASPKASLKVSTVTLSGSTTLPNTEQKKTVTLTSSKTYNKSNYSIVGVVAITFSNNHHEITFSDYDVSINSNNKIEAKITIPTKAEIRGASTNITVKVSVISTSDVIDVTPEFSGPTYG